MKKSELEDLSYVHLFPSDLEEMDKSECGNMAFSVPQGHPDKGETVPLFTMKQVADILSKLA
jgi:hypothetical protein